MKRASKPSASAGGASAETARLRLHFRLEIGVAAAFILLGLVFLRQVWANLPLFSYGQVGPGLLPGLVGFAMVGLGAAIAVEQVLKERALIGDETPQTDVIPNLRDAGRVLAVILLLIAGRLLIPVVGMLAALGIVLLSQLCLVERRPFVTSFMVLGGLLVFIYLAFESLLGIPLPAGVLGLG